MLNELHHAAGHDQGRRPFPIHKLAAQTIRTSEPPAPPNMVIRRVVHPQCDARHSRSLSTCVNLAAAHPGKFRPGVTDGMEHPNIHMGARPLQC